MTYRVQDGDANTADSDAATLTFTVTVEEAPEPDTQLPAFSQRRRYRTRASPWVRRSAPWCCPRPVGGNGPLSYSLAPSIPGLSFDQNSLHADRHADHGWTAITSSTGLRMAIANTAASDVQRRSPSRSRWRKRQCPIPRPALAASHGSRSRASPWVRRSTPLVLPAASGGNGSSELLSDALDPGAHVRPEQPHAERCADHGWHAITSTYRVEDGDANTAASDAATLTFTVTVQEAPVPDTAPSFGSQTVPVQSFTVGEAISALVLPAASGGNGPLSYSLTPSIPGLSFDQNSRTLTGTPTTAGTHNMTYRVQDGDANTAASDAATLTFTVTVTVTVQDPSTPYMGCSSDAETWRGLRVCSERPREGYDRDDYGTGYRSLEDEIIAALPETMKAEWQGLHALLLHRVRHHVEWDCRHRHRAYRRAGGGARQRDRRRSAPGHRQRPGQSHDCGSNGEPLAEKCEGRSRMDADPPRRVVRGTRDPGKAGIRVDRRSG